MGLWRRYYIPVELTQDEIEKNLCNYLELKSPSCLQPYDHLLLVEIENPSFEELEVLAQKCASFVPKGSKVLLLAHDEEGFPGGFLVMKDRVFEVYSELIVSLNGKDVPLGALELALEESHS